MFDVILRVLATEPRAPHPDWQHLINGICLRLVRRNAHAGRMQRAGHANHTRRLRNRQRLARLFSEAARPDDQDPPESFMGGVGGDLRNCPIVIGTITTARMLGLRMITEGVETARHAGETAELQRQIVWSFAMARPMPAEEIAR